MRAWASCSAAMASGSQTATAASTSPEEIARNYDRTRDQMLEQQRGEAFNVFINSIMQEYKKGNRIRMAAKAKPAEIPNT